MCVCVGGVCSPSFCDRWTPKAVRSRKSAQCEIVLRILPSRKSDSRDTYLNSLIHSGLPFPLPFVFSSLPPLRLLTPLPPLLLPRLPSFAPCQIHIFDAMPRPQTPARPWYLEGLFGSFHFGLDDEIEGGQGGGLEG